ncbi:lactate racemization operon protein [Loigolactobacillus backii]|uniref:nickel insertion protein n=1 Tax=Loigolactobacillus backii TaxID=375175 RepID=UPI000C358E79|nr:nickel insertion protein [Loigolactobacillus backii]PIO82405.1 lactate racemization operon protein [Loigolactobacillus backii]
MEANLDDQTGEALGYVMNLLLDAGALDVFFTPIQMKKNRPAVELSVLIRPIERAKFARLILQETSTIGVRYQKWQRTVMTRSFEKVTTEYGQVRVKVATYDDLVKRTPEYEDCLKLAQKQHVTLTAVYQAAIQQFQ